MVFGQLFSVTEHCYSRNTVLCNWLFNNSGATVVMKVAALLASVSEMQLREMVQGSRFTVAALLTPKAACLLAQSMIDSPAMHSHVTALCYALKRLYMKNMPHTSLEQPST